MLILFFKLLLLNHIDKTDVLLLPDVHVKLLEIWIITACVFIYLGSNLLSNDWYVDKTCRKILLKSCLVFFCIKHKSSWM